MKIRKGDTVKIILGKDNGKSAKVLKVLPKKMKILVEGVNVYKRRINAKRQGVNSEGGILDITKPVNISNVMLICPSCKKATKVGFKSVKKDKIRICKKCGKEIYE